MPGFLELGDTWKEEVVEILREVGSSENAKSGELEIPWLKNIWEGSKGSYLVLKIIFFHKIMLIRDLSFY